MGRVRLEQGSALAAVAAAAGWTIADDGVPLVDRRASPGAVPPGAVVVVTRGDAAALDAAVADGAAGFVEAPVTAVALGAALAIAARALRRRAGEEPHPGDVLVERALAAGGARAVAIVALTRFDIVNAAFGRAAGDDLLAQAEARLRAAAGAAVQTVRRGGAEFLLIADALTALDVPLVAAERALAEPFAAGAARVSLGSRIGVATAIDGDDAARLLHRAEAALRGEGTAAIPVAADAALAADLHHAMARGEIELLFQPQIAFASGLVTGVEALARWRHPVRGELGAGALFAAAAHAELGVALSDHIHRLALARAAAWPASLATLRLSINVTADDLARRDFAERLLAAIDASGVARARVTVEVTESGLIERLDEAGLLLGELRAAGLRTAIDDFGTGYSSLAYLKALPLDYLKIDRALAQDVTGTSRDRIVVEGVVAMARSLGLETIAEGVETRAQAQALAALGCTHYQGFLCAGPLDDAALVAFVEEE